MQPLPSAWKRHDFKSGKKSNQRVVQYEVLQMELKYIEVGQNPNKSFDYGHNQEYIEVRDSTMKNPPCPIQQRRKCCAQEASICGNNDKDKSRRLTNGGPFQVVEVLINLSKTKIQQKCQTTVYKNVWNV